MNLSTVMTFEQFCHIHMLSCEFNYLDCEKKEETYLPRKMNEILLENLWNRLFPISFNTIQIRNYTFADGDGIYVKLISTTHGVAEILRDNIQIMPKYEDVLNSKRTVVVTNLYDVDSSKKDFLTVLITNAFPSLESIPFKNDVSTVVDIRGIREEEWDSMISRNIIHIQYHDDRMIIHLKHPIIKLLMVE